MSTIIMPVIVPHKSSPDLCPKCKNIESIKQACNHCGYEYPEDDNTETKDILIALTAITLFCYILVTLIWWLINSDNNSLVDIFISQWEFISNLKIW